MSSNRPSGNLQMEIHDFVSYPLFFKNPLQLCLYHNVKRNTKDSSPHPINGDDQRSEQLIRLLYKILTEIDQRIAALPGPSGIQILLECILEPSPPEYFDDWTFISWTLLSIIIRLESNPQESLLNFENGQCLEKMHAALIVLVNRAKPIEPPAMLDIVKDPYYGQFFEVLANRPWKKVFCSRTSLPFTTYTIYTPIPKRLTINARPGNTNAILPNSKPSLLYVWNCIRTFVMRQAHLLCKYRVVLATCLHMA